MVIKRLAVSVCVAVYMPFSLSTVLLYDDPLPVEVPKEILSFCLELRPDRHAMPQEDFTDR